MMQVNRNHKQPQRKSRRMLLLCALAFSVAGSGAASSRDFSYTGQYGPDHWAEQFNTCSGKHQSPININILEVKNRPYWPIDITHFDRSPKHGSLMNNGHTVLVNLDYSSQEVPTVSQGPLEGKGTFKFVQLHFHWGENNTEGSEDRINNHAFPAELHMVFFNDKYNRFEEAAKYKDGVTVLAFFFGIKSADNPNYEEFTELLQDIREPGRLSNFASPPSLKELIVKDLNNYFTYTGSMTTPPCSEDVIWIDFATPIMISGDQIDSFRQLNTYNGKPLTHNFRPLQPLNNRTIFKPVSLPTFPFDQVVSSIPFIDDINGASALQGWRHHYFVAIIMPVIISNTAFWAY